MTIVIEISIALTLAILFYAAFSIALKRVWWPTAVIWIPLLILFLAIWAGGIWIKPFGSQIANIYWMPYAAAGLLAAVILAVATPPWWPPKNMADNNTAPNTAREARNEKKLAGGLFWFCIGLLLLSIAAHYLAGT